MKENTPAVHISLIDEGLPFPTFHTSGSSAFDIYVRLDCHVKPKELAYLPSNLVVRYPKGYALLILPRSSLFRRTGLIFPHSVGLIDRDYCGQEDEILLQVYNLSEKEVFIAKGTRIAQGLLVKSESLPLICEPLSQKPLKNRGGFGSTGCHASEEREER